MNKVPTQLSKIKSLIKQSFHNLIQQKQSQKKQQSSYLSYNNNNFKVNKCKSQIYKYTNNQNNIDNHDNLLPFQQVSLKQNNSQKIPLKIVNNMNQYPYQTFGWLNILYLSKIQYATGFLINPTIIITAAQNIYKKTQNPYVFQEPISIFFYSTQRNCYKGYPQKIKSIYINPRYKTCELSRAKFYNIAILQLSQPVNTQPFKNFQFLKLGILPTQKEMYLNTKINIFGYPQQLILKIDSKRQLVYMHKAQGEIKHFQNQICFYDATTAFGMSGSPIIIQYDHQLYIIGIHTQDNIKQNQGLLFTKELFRLFGFSQMQNAKIIFQTIFNSNIFHKLPVKLNSYKKELKKVSYNVQILDKRAVFYNMDDQNIIAQIEKLKNLEITQISLKNNIKVPVTNNVQVIQKLSQLKTVQRIQLIHCYDISSDISTKIVSCFGKDQIKQLVFSCHKKTFQDFFVFSLCHKFPNLRRFHYNRRSSPQHFQTMFQDAYFIQFFFKQDTGYLRNQQVMQLSQLKKLQNIDIFDIEDQLSPQILQDFKNLKHLTFGNWFKQQQLSSKILNQLMKFTQLKTLEIVRVKIQQKENTKKIIKFISQNIYIENLLLDQSFKSLKDEHIDFIGQRLKSLKKFLCYYLPHITGIHFDSFIELKVLFMFKCQNIVPEKLAKAISKMKKLTHLLLPGNKWVNDQIMAAIGKNCTQIQMLNIEGSLVSSIGLLKATTLKKLKCFICGFCQQITGQDLVLFSKKVSCITKLSISGMISRFKIDSFSGQHLLKIDSNCNPGITHLNISKCDIGVKCLSKMKALKVFKVEGKYHFRKQEEDQLEIFLKQKNVVRYMYQID